MSRYIILRKPIDMDFDPSTEKISEEMEAQILSDASYIVREACEKIKDYKFSEDILDKLAQSISILGTFPSWDIFCKHDHNEEYITWAAKLVMNPRSQNELNIKANESLAGFVSVKKMLGFLDNKQEFIKKQSGVLINNKRLIRRAIKEDLTNFKNYKLEDNITKVYSFLTLSNLITQPIPTYPNTIWALINDVSEVISCFLMLGLTKEQIDLTIKREKYFINSTFLINRQDWEYIAFSCFLSFTESIKNEVYKYLIFPFPGKALNDKIYISADSRIDFFEKKEPIIRKHEYIYCVSLEDLIILHKA